MCVRVFYFEFSAQLDIIICTIKIKTNIEVVINTSYQHVESFYNISCYHLQILKSREETFLLLFQKLKIFLHAATPVSDCIVEEMEKLR